MKKENDPKTYLLITGVVALVAIVALVLNSTGSLEGAAFGEVQVNTFQKVCKDNEPGNDKNVFGIVYYGNKEFHDYCQGTQVVQRRCEDGKNVGRLRPVDCDSGYTCKLGACSLI